MQASSNKSPSNTISQKQYVILTYENQSDTVRFPLPLVATKEIPSSVLFQVIRRLRNQLVTASMKPQHKKTRKHALKRSRNIFQRSRTRSQGVCGYMSPTHSSMSRSVNSRSRTMSLKSTSRKSRKNNMKRFNGTKHRHHKSANSFSGRFVSQGRGFRGRHFKKKDNDVPVQPVKLSRARKISQKYRKKNSYILRKNRFFRSPLSRTGGKPYSPRSWQSDLRSSRGSVHSRRRGSNKSSRKGQNIQDRLHKLQQYLENVSLN